MNSKRASRLDQPNAFARKRRCAKPLSVGFRFLQGGFSSDNASTFTECRLFVLCSKIKPDAFPIFFFLLAAIVILIANQLRFSRRPLPRALGKGVDGISRFIILIGNRSRVERSFCLVLDFCSRLGSASRMLNFDIFHGDFAIFPGDTLCPGIVLVTCLTPRSLYKQQTGRKAWGERSVPSSVQLLPTDLENQSNGRKQRDSMKKMGTIVPSVAKQPLNSSTVEGVEREITFSAKSRTSGWNDAR